MPSASPKKSKKSGKSTAKSVSGGAATFRSQALADALAHQDMAAVALALRNGNTVVPLMRVGPRDNPLDGGEVWTYRSPETGEVALLLFSDAANKPANLPPAVGLQSPTWLRAFLGA